MRDLLLSPRLLLPPQESYFLFFLMPFRRLSNMAGGSNTICVVSQWTILWIQKLLWQSTSRTGTGPANFSSSLIPSSLSCARKMIKLPICTLSIMGLCLLLFGGVSNSLLAVTAPSLVCSILSFMSSCIRTTCWPQWVHNSKSICGGRNIWPHSKLFNSPPSSSTHRRLCSMDAITPRFSVWLCVSTRFSSLDYFSTFTFR